MLNDIRITLTIVCLMIGIFFLDCGVKVYDTVAIAPVDIIIIWAAGHPLAVNTTVPFGCIAPAPFRMVPDTVVALAK